MAFVPAYEPPLEHTPVFLDPHDPLNQHGLLSIFYYDTVNLTIRQSGQSGHPAPSHTPGYPALTHTTGYPALAHQSGYPAPAHSPGYPALAHPPGYPTLAHTPGYTSFVPAYEPPFEHTPAFLDPHDPFNQHGLLSIIYYDTVNLTIPPIWRGTR